MTELYSDQPQLYS